MLLFFLCVCVFIFFMMKKLFRCHGSRSSVAERAPEEKEEDSCVNDTWRACCLNEVSKDFTAVTRDFPRIPVYVSTGRRNNYCEQEGEKTAAEGDAGANDETGVQNGAVFAKRNQRVRTAVELLMELCDEDTTTLQSVWQAEEPRFSAADISSLLLAVFLRSGLLRKRKDGEDEGAVKGEGALPDGGAAVSSSSGYVAQSRALRVMQYMVQSVVFFSVQWLISVLRFPWCKHMQDTMWTIHVYSEKGVRKNPGTGEEEEETLLVVQHKQTLRHHVTRADRRVRPRFEVDWTCAVVLDPRHIPWGGAEAPKMGDGAEVRRIDAVVLSARVETPPRTLCWLSPSWRRRRDELSARLRDRFGVELHSVATLQKSTSQ